MSNGETSREPKDPALIAVELAIVALRERGVYYVGDPTWVVPSLADNVAPPLGESELPLIDLRQETMTARAGQMTEADVDARVKAILSMPAHLIAQEVNANPATAPIELPFIDLS